MNSSDEQTDRHAAAAPLRYLCHAKDVSGGVRAMDGWLILSFFFVVYLCDSTGRPAPPSFLSPAARCAALLIADQPSAERTPTDEQTDVHTTSEGEKE